ncbi:MAG: DUF2934 domain-containing protein [Prosthecobacter sp.]|uniref:DUF2934 domain-containing protein n=1 Tax=Prosthecobacter sp. TaxID=1965333 RepID=UPI003900216B
MKQTSLAIPPPPFNAIHARAYHRWQHANRPTGQDVDFWRQPEQQVMPQPQASAAAATASAKAPSNAKTAAKVNPQAALTSKPKLGTQRSTKPPTR